MASTLSSRVWQHTSVSASDTSSTMNYCKLLLVLCAAIAVAMIICPNNVQAQETGEYMTVMDARANSTGHVTLTSAVNFTVKVEACWGTNTNYSKPLIWLGAHKTVTFPVAYTPGSGDWLSCYMTARYRNGTHMRLHLAFVPVWPGFNGTVEPCIDCLWTVRNDGFYRLLKKGWTLITHWYF